MDNPYDWSIYFKWDLHLLLQMSLNSNVPYRGKKSELNKTGLKISREKILSLMKNLVTFAQFYFS